VIKRAFADLAERRIDIACTIWGWADPFAHEFVLAVPEDVRQTEVFRILKYHFGASKLKEPGRTLGLLQAPQRVPRIANERLVPLYRYQGGRIIAYQDVAQSNTGPHDPICGLLVQCRRWFRAEPTESEHYEPVHS
jgi:hypothetical protein